MRPTFEATPGRYTGPVPIVTHVHGSASVGDESDGYAEAWYLPDANDIPELRHKGHLVRLLRGQGGFEVRRRLGPGSATFQYPNSQRASTIWYHDHALGMTRLNVYAGPAGFFLIRGGPEGDGAVLDSRTGTKAVLPGPAPKANDPFPANKTYYEVPIAIQDRSFDANGSLFYPDTRAFFDHHRAVHPRDGRPRSGTRSSSGTPSWSTATRAVPNRRAAAVPLPVPERVPIGFPILDFSEIPGVEVWQIGNEGGFLAAPVNLTDANANRLLLGLAERADVVVDFTNVSAGEYVLRNLGPTTLRGRHPRR